jgi:hypothetical protein
MSVDFLGDPKPSLHFVLSLYSFTIGIYLIFELILLPDVQLPFPVDCLYADPDRKVMCCSVH